MIRIAAIAVAVTTLLAAGVWFITSQPTPSGNHLPTRVDQPTAVPLSAPPNSTSAVQSRGSIGSRTVHPASNRATASSSSPAGAPKQRTWDTNFFAKLGHPSEGNPIRFELVDGKIAAGTITKLQGSQAEVIHVSGKLTKPEPGQFFFQKQSMDGVAGLFVGVVEFPASKQAYRLEPTGPGGTSELVERSLSSVRCLELPQPIVTPAMTREEIPPLNPDEFPTLSIPEYQKGIILLQSLTGSKAVVYLDFQGGYTTAWGGISYARPNFNNAQIREIWKRVAEDFMPFNINVVTDLKVFENAPGNSRQRVIITPTDTADPRAGGVSYVGSFNWTGDTPCWAFVTYSTALTNAAQYCAQACAHEAGHTLGLIHDGQQINDTHFEYYFGHGSGDTGWAPIMGVGYDKNVTQWSKGEYAYANNFEDQIIIIANQNNNVSLRAADTGNTLATSRYLEIYDDDTASGEGLIGSEGGAEAFQFTTGGGSISLRADPVARGPDLAIAVTLSDAAGVLLASNTPSTTLWAAIETNLSAGTYTFSVMGAGRNDPLTNGFSSYDSRGYYSITGQVANARLPNRFAIPEYATNGTIVAVVPANDPAGDSLVYAITAGNSNSTFAISNSGTLTVVNNQLLDYELLATNSEFPVQFELLVDITDLTSPQLTELHRRVIVAITNVNEPPSITGFVVTNSTYVSAGGGYFGGLFGSGLFGNFSGAVFEGASDWPGSIPQFNASILEHSPPGTVIGTVLASDPDFFTLLSYSIVDGNSNGVFAIGHESGTITVAGDPVAAVQNLYKLTIAVSDQTPRVPLMATSMVTIKVELPYRAGSISYAVYTNISGTLVSALTNDPSFPTDPAFEGQASSFAARTMADQGLGAVMRGYLLPPATGDYTFWIASQDNSELWLGTSTNPASMQRIAYISGETNWAAEGDWTKFPTQQSAPIPLAVGYAYYIEARMKAGTGTNYVGVAWECASNGLAQQVIPGQYLAPYFINYIPHPIGFTANLHRDALAGTQVGVVRVSDVNADDVERLVISSGNDDAVFSLDPSSGLITLINSTALQATSRTSYSLQVVATDNGIPPLSGSNVVTVNIVSSNAITAGSIMAEVWTNIAGTNVLELTSNAKYPKRPDLLNSLTALEMGNFGVAVIYFSNTGPLFSTNAGVFNSGASSSNTITLGSNGPSSPALSSSSPGPAYGSRIRAFLTPTNTGPYTFFISSADDSQLLLSSTTNPAQAEIVASVAGGRTDYQDWSRYGSQQSHPFWLVAGNQYYIESVQKFYDPEGSSGGIIFAGPWSGHVEVGWAGPGLSGTNVIDGSFLSPVDIEYAPELPNQTVMVPITSADGALLSTLTASDSAMDTLSYRIVSGNLSNTFALDPTSGALSVADNSSFAGYAESNFTLIVEVQDSGYGGLYPLKSTRATISLPVVDNSPAILWSGDASDNNWASASNWNGALPNDRSKLSFIGTGQRTNYNDLLASVGMVTLGSAGYYLEGNPLLLRGGLLSSGNNCWAINSTLDGPQQITASSGTLALEGVINTDGNSLKLIAYSAIRMDGVVAGSGGLTKSASGTVFLMGSNSYTGPTLVEKGALVLTNSGSIALSSSIDVQAGAIFNVSGTAEIFTVPAGQTLTGNGTVIGPIIVEGTLSPAPSPGSYQPVSIGFSNRLVLKGDTALTISRNSSSSQLLRVSGELDLGGTLTVLTNRGEYLTPGQTFKLFDAEHFAGAFTNLNLPLGFAWDMSRLAIDGTIRVTQIVPIPVAIAPIISTNGLFLIRFPTTAGRTYILESCGSLRSVHNWSPIYTRSGNGTIMSFTVGAPPQAIPQRFFRLRVE